MADASYPTVWDGYLESGRPARVIPLPSGGARTQRAPTYPDKGNGNVDTYDLTDPNYDPDAWYTGARGADGRQRNTSVRLPDHIGRSIDELVAKGAFPPVRTVSDFVRSAVVHELHRRIAEIRDPDFAIQISAHTALETALAMEAEEEAQKDTVSRYRQRLADNEDNPVRLRRWLDQVWGAMDGGNFTGPLYRQLEELSNKYGVGYLKPRLVEEIDIRDHRDPQV